MINIERTVGPATAIWDAETPLRWSMTESVGKGDSQTTAEEDFDLTPLIPGYEFSFLIALKESFIERRRRVALITISREHHALRALFLTFQKRELIVGKVHRIDAPFLLALNTISNQIPQDYLGTFRRLYQRSQGVRSMFDEGIASADFPSTKSGRGAHGDRIHRILSKVLTRAAQVAVLKAAEDAYEDGRIDIGYYAFSHLAMHTFCRPNSYRQIRVGDFTVHTDPESGERCYQVMIPTSKSQTHEPGSLPYSLNSHVGELLALQRKSVIEKFGHLVTNSDLAKLALFPARKLHADGTWVSKNASENFGVIAPRGFSTAYLKPIKELVQGAISFNALRHTVGTQLAASGCSAQTIAAVLRHASIATCQAYVDITFGGLIDRLSEGINPSFDKFFPAYDTFRSQSDPIDPSRKIESEDIKSGKIEITGECGRHVACQYAPLACYECPRFIPCHDADHSINLRKIDEEIAEYKSRGHAFRPLLEKSKHIRRYIQIVVAACDKHRIAALT